MIHPVPLRSTRSALRRLADDPVGQLVYRWNWKSALLGSLWRGPVFAALAARRGWLPGTAEILLQAATAGFSGAVAQSFHRVRPAWRGCTAAAGLILCLQQPLEFALHRIPGMPHFRGGVLISVGSTVAVAAVNMVLMRRGYLMVGNHSGHRDRGSRGETYVA